MTRPSYRREMVAATTIPLLIALVEGGVTGTIMANLFGPVLRSEPTRVSPIEAFLVAALTAAPMFANLTSFFWAHLARGRSKIRFINSLQLILLLSASSIAFIPITVGGAFLFTGLVILCRCLMVGIITARSTVWRQNYPRSIRGTITSRLALVATSVIVVSSIAAAALLDHDPRYFRYIFPAAAMISVIGVIAYSRVRTRGERLLIRDEKSARTRIVPRGDLGEVYEADTARRPGMIQVLRRDQTYRRYLLWQFIAGCSNMMITAPMILVAIELADAIGTFRLSGRSFSLNFMIAIALTTAIPMTFATITLPFWAKILDRTHVIHFRTMHGWTWIFRQSGLFLGAFVWVSTGSATTALLLLTLAAISDGLMRGGGMLAWQLGHNDFASREMTAVYMGIHVTLTGVRGATAPFIGAALYTGWDQVAIPAINFTIPAYTGIGVYVFLTATILAVIALAGYYGMYVELKHQGKVRALDG